MIKNTNSKMTPNSQLSTTEPKNCKNKNTLSKQLEQEQNQIWRSHGGLSAGRGGEGMGGKVQGIRSISGRYKIDRGRLRIMWEMEKPKNVYVRPMDMT